MEAIDKAQREIAAILSKLETESGMIVKRIGLESLDVTQITDVGPQHMMQVRIELQRLPGHQW